MAKKIETIQDLQPNPENSNRGTPRGHGVIEHSLRQRGAGRSGLAAADGTMIAGNQTLQKVAELGIPIRPVHTTGDEWVVVIRDDVEPGSEEARLLELEDNRASELGLSYDPEVLASLREDMDLSQLFHDDEIAALLAGVGEEPDIGGAGDDFDTTPDDGPTRTQAGDLWQIGPHRLIVGDCTDPAVVERLMGGERADAALLWSDPPFGIGYTGHGASVDGRANKFAPIDGDDAPDPAWLVLWLPRDDGAIYLKTTWGVLHEWERYLGELAAIRSRIVWDKCSHVAGDVVGGYATQSEIILFASVARHKISRFDTDVWSIPRATTGAPEQRTGHPYESPIALPLRAIENSSKVGDLVLDPFIGSGSSLIAAHRSKRRLFGCELKPKWADVILRRAESAGLSVQRLEAAV